MGYEKEAYLYLLFHYTGKKDFQESTLKIQMLMIGLAQTSHFGLWDIIPPRDNMRTHLRAKGLVGTRGGNDVLKIVFYFLYV